MTDIDLSVFGVVDVPAKVVGHQRQICRGIF